MINRLPKIITYKESEYVHKSAQIIKNLIQELTSNSKKINIAISGGKSPLPIYGKLKTFDLKWENISFFLVDERCVPNEDPQSNYKNIKEHFFDFIPSNNYPIISSEKPYKELAINYEELITKSLKKVNKLPKFDIIILGMGLDGHTASLFPDTKALIENKKLVVTNEIPQLKTKRITMTYPLILNAKNIILLIRGDKKLKVLQGTSNDILPISKIISHINLILN